MIASSRVRGISCSLQMTKCHFIGQMGLLRGLGEGGLFAEGRVLGLASTRVRSRTAGHGLSERGEHRHQERRRTLHGNVRDKQTSYSCTRGGLEAVPIGI